MHDISQVLLKGQIALDFRLDKQLLFHLLVLNYLASD